MKTESSGGGSAAANLTKLKTGLVFMIGIATGFMLSTMIEAPSETDIDSLFDTGDIEAFRADAVRMETNGTTVIENEIQDSSSTLVSERSGSEVTFETSRDSKGSKDSEVTADALMAMSSEEDPSHMLVKVAEETCNEMKAANPGAHIYIDKVQWHHYEHFYSWFLSDYKRRHKRQIKMLEIGLGCGGHFAAGFHMWTRLFPPPNAIWEADFNKKCVDKWKSEGKLVKAAGVLTGDQNDTNVLRRWVSETRGNFDIIIDDGGHTNMQILNTFKILFPEALNPGGLYFIEDLMVGRHKKYDDSNGRHIISEVIQEWIDQLIIKGFGNGNDHRLGKAARYRHLLPAKVNSIHVQDGMVMIKKCSRGERCPID